jgi:hypothetical protein
MDSPYINFVNKYIGILRLHLLYGCFHISHPESGYKGKKKLLFELIKLYSIKTKWGTGCIDPLTLDPCTNCKCVTNVELHSSAALPPGNEVPVSIG